MAVLAASVTVAITATELTGQDAGGPTSSQTLLIKVPAGGQVVYIGGAGVTTAAGFPVAAGESEKFDLHEGDRLFGIVAATTQVVNALRTGV